MRLHRADLTVNWASLGLVEKARQGSLFAARVDGNKVRTVVAGPPLGVVAVVGRKPRWRQLLASSSVRDVVDRRD